MLASRHWRDWLLPDCRNKSPEFKLPKPPKPFLSVLSVPTLPVCGAKSEANAVSTHDPAAWRSDFNRWQAQRCVSRLSYGFEDAGGIGCLFLDFAEWCADYDAAPPRREIFEALLRDAGFCVADGFVCGLILRADFEAYQGVS
jgi:hypothetical protein